MLFDFNIIEKKKSQLGFLKKRKSIQKFTRIHYTDKNKGIM